MCLSGGDICSDHVVGSRHRLSGNDLAQYHLLVGSGQWATEILEM